jgi:alpha-glucosidase (family GH31 glycosyl hydrolase)
MGLARFSVLTDACVRMEYSPTGEFVDAPSLFAIERRGDVPVHVVEDGGEPIVLETPALVLEYTPGGGGFTAGNLRIHVGEAEWRPGMRQTGNLGGTLETLDRVRGRVALPDGLLSRDGWYLHDDSGTHLIVDGWAAARPARVRGNTDWYFFGYGTDYRAALRGLASASGPAPMPRRYALGSWYSRYWPYTSGEYREIVGEYDRRGYPLDVIVMDMDWHKPGWTGWSWNRELLPDAEELLRWFHGEGLAVTLNLHPADGVGPHEDEYGAFMRAIGRDPSTKETVAFDAGDRRYAEALFRIVHGALEGAGSDDAGQRGDGVDFWWLDWQQEKFTRSIPDLTNLWWLNHLYFTHTSRDGVRGCSFSRWAGWGDHRHPVHFSGDAHTGWESLAFQVPFTAVAGNVGCFFWSHDIGGHFGPRLEEATTRWVQFGALSPVLRLHSARSGALDRRPWSYEERYERAMRKAFRLRSELFPYIYSMARKCHTEMVPLCRPMYIDWPDAPEAYENPQEYMFGDELLVAPITSAGAGDRKVGVQAVWFPGEETEGRDEEPERGRDGVGSGTSGAAWYHWETGEAYEGGSERLVGAEIDEIPMFVRGGVPIVTREATLRMATEPLKKLVVVCYPGEAGSYHEFELYEDDGISDGHARGEYSVTPVRAWWFRNELKLEVGIRVGMFAGMVEDREVVLELRGVERATMVRVDDDARGAMEGVQGRVRIEGGKLGAAEVVRFAVRFEAERQDAARLRMFDRRVAGLVGHEDLEAVWLRRCARVASFSPAEHLALLGLSGTGFRCDGNTLHMYLAKEATKTLEDALGGTVTRRVEIRASAEPGCHETWEMPEMTLAPKLGLTARRAIVYVDTGVAQPGRIVLVTKTEPLRDFRVVGPFAYDPTKPMGEQRAGPELVRASERVSASYADKAGKAAAWQEAPSADYWPQAIRQVCGGHNGEAMAYALTHVWSPKEQEVTLLLESGDRLELWIGDERVFTSDDAEAAESAVEEVRATLKKGWNQVMGKTNEGGGGWGFRVSIDGTYELRESFVPG